MKVTDLPRGTEFIGPDGNPHRVTIPASESGLGWVFVYQLHSDIPDHLRDAFYCGDLLTADVEVISSTPTVECEHPTVSTPRRDVALPAETLRCIGACGARWTTVETMPQDVRNDVLRASNNCEDDLDLFVYLRAIQRSGHVLQFERVEWEGTPPPDVFKMIRDAIQHPNKWATVGKATPREQDGHTHLGEPCVVPVAEDELIPSMDTALDALRETRVKPAPLPD